MGVRGRFLATISLIGLYLPFTKYGTRNLSSFLRIESSATLVEQEHNLTQSIQDDEEVHGDGHCLLQRTTGPTPVILMTQGRSGSHSTWQILGNLTGYETKADEYTGSNSSQSKTFFEDVIGDNHPNWIVDAMCRKQRKALQKDRSKGAEDGIVGFNWKPFSEDMVRTGVQQGLSVIADLAKSENPLEHVRIVRSSRNALDLFLSRTKHKSSHLRAHCYTESCVERHEQAAHAISVNCTEVVKVVEKFVEQERFVDEQLALLGVPAVRVTYDVLYYPETPEDGSAEWNKIFKFLGKRSNYTWDEILSAMALVPTTTSRSHRDRIENFNELEGALSQVNLQHLLRQ